MERTVAKTLSLEVLLFLHGFKKNSYGTLFLSFYYNNSLKAWENVSNKKWSTIFFKLPKIIIIIFLESDIKAPRPSFRFPRIPKDELNFRRPCVPVPRVPRVPDDGSRQQRDCRYTPRYKGKQAFSLLRNILHNTTKVSTDTLTKNILKMYILTFQTILSIFFPTKTYIFLADKGFSPPPLSGHVR